MKIMRCLFTVIVLFLLCMTIFGQNHPVISESYRVLNETNGDPYDQYLAIMDINDTGNLSTLTKRNNKTHILDSIIGFQSPNNFFDKTTFVWEEDKVTEYNHIKIFQTKDWIPQGCSEFGLNAVDQITYSYFGTCGNTAPRLSREYFYDDQNKLIRRVIFMVASGSFPENNNVTLYTYDDEDRLIEEANFDSDTDSLILSSRSEFFYNQEDQLSSIVRYHIASIGIYQGTEQPLDSISLVYNQGLLIRLSLIHI